MTLYKHPDGRLMVSKSGPGPWKNDVWPETIWLRGEIVEYDPKLQRLTHTRRSDAWLMEELNVEVIEVEVQMECFP